ncbi:MAG: class I tRNA ligase family protein, partial [Acidobacteriaceae bacterium]
ALVRLVAPILTFTADEVWQYLPPMSDRAASVHLALFPKAEELGAADVAILEEWRRLLSIREQVFGALEIERKAGRIGKGLEAAVRIEAKSPDWELLNQYRSSLKELLNVSEVDVAFDPESSGARSADDLSLMEGRSPYRFSVSPAAGHKCDRCWNYYPDDSPQHVRRFGAWDNVCGRCADALRQMGYNEAAQ